MRLDGREATALAADFQDVDMLGERAETPLDPSDITLKLAVLASRLPGVERRLPPRYLTPRGGP